MTTLEKIANVITDRDGADLEFFVHREVKSAVCSTNESIEEIKSLLLSKCKKQFIVFLIFKVSHHLELQNRPF